MTSRAALVIGTLHEPLGRKISKVPFTQRNARFSVSSGHPAPVVELPIIAPDLLMSTASLNASIYAGQLFRSQCCNSHHMLPWVQYLEEQDSISSVSGSHRKAPFVVTPS